MTAAHKVTPSSRRRWSQWLNKKLKKYGKTDEVQLHKIVDRLKTVHNIPAELIKKDFFLLLDKQDYHVIDIVPFVTIQQMALKPLVRRPDIIILDKETKKKPVLIIELDGSVHHTPSGLKRTFKRNGDYSYARIPLIVIDDDDLKYLETSWFEYLDSELKKRGDQLTN